MKEKLSNEMLQSVTGYQTTDPYALIKERQPQQQQTETAETTEAVSSAAKEEKPKAKAKESTETAAIEKEKKAAPRKKKTVAAKDQPQLKSRKRNRKTSSYSFSVDEDKKVKWNAFCKALNVQTKSFCEAALNKYVDEFPMTPEQRDRFERTYELMKSVYAINQEVDQIREDEIHSDEEE